MRVLLATDGLGPGGAERQFCLLCERLMERADVAVWALHGGSGVSVIESLGVPFVIGTHGNGSRLRAVRSAMAFSSGFHPTVVHPWGWISPFLMEPAARRAGAAHVTGLVRMGTLPRRKRARLLLASRLGSLCIGNSAAGLSSWRVPARRARFVPNGFDSRRIEGLESSPGGHAVFTAVMAGSMSAHKDFGTLIRTAAILRSGFPGRFRFDLLGDGPDRCRLEEFAAGERCGDSVAFHGRTDDVMQYLVDADAGVLLSPMGEGMSNFLMECMAAGLPVICTDTGGNSELVRDSVDGWTVPPGDADAVADRLEELAADKALCAGMGSSGRARILADFSVEAMVQATLDVYSEALGMKGAV
jgi:glycosyltransferase involved in cell wall biosynthesis